MKDFRSLNHNDWQRVICRSHYIQRFHFKLKEKRIQIQIQISNFEFSNHFSSWRQCPSTQKLNHHPNLPIRSSCLVATLRMCLNGVLSSTFGLFFGFVHFCPYQEVVRGKPKKRQVARENKKQMAPTLPSPSLHPKSPPFTSTLLSHILCTSSLVPMIVWW